MQHRHITTTTSFIVSSDESLNKPYPSPYASVCGRSTDSSENMSTVTANSVSDSHTDQSYLSQSSTDSLSTNNISNTSNHRQSYQLVNGRFAMLPPQPIVPPPPPPIPLNIQERYYDPSANSDTQIRPTSATDNIFEPAINVVSTNRSDSTSFHGIYGSHNVSESGHRLPLDPSSGVLPQPVHSSLIQHSIQDNNSLVKTVQRKQKYSASNGTIQKASITSLDTSTQLMPMNVKGMLLHGLSSEEVMRNWLQSLKCDDLIKSFVEHGYDIHLITKMTPQDLAAIGCRSPALRKKLLLEIKKLNLDYDLPDYKPMILERWLESLKLKSYYTLLVREGYDTVEKVCQLTWEDLEEIGVIRLGHQKQLLLGIDKVKKSLRVQEERQNDSAIYDTHPNHRMSLNGSNLDGKMNTIGRVRSGLFQTRSGANLDHRGLPVAYITPTLKHISSPIINADDTSLRCDTIQISEDVQKGHGNVESLNMNELTVTLKKNPPLPPVRTNSLKFNQLQINEQFIYDSSHSAMTRNSNGPNGISMSSRSASFLYNRGTLTDDMNSQQVATTSRSSIMPVREAPLPPHMQNRLSIQEKIDEEPSTAVCAEQQSACSNPMGNNMYNDSSQFAVAGLQIVSADEFPPPPP